MVPVEWMLEGLHGYTDSVASICRYLTVIEFVLLSACAYASGQLSLAPLEPLYWWDQLLSSNTYLRLGTGTAWSIGTARLRMEVASHVPGRSE